MSFSSYLQAATHNRVNIVLVPTHYLNTTNLILGVNFPSPSVSGKLSLGGYHWLCLHLWVDHCWLGVYFPFPSSVLGKLSLGSYHQLHRILGSCQIKYLYYNLCYKLELTFFSPDAATFPEKKLGSLLHLTFCSHIQGVKVASNNGVSDHYRYTIFLRPEDQIVGR